MAIHFLFIATSIGITVAGLFWLTAAIIRNTVNEFQIQIQPSLIRIPNLSEKRQ
mgnify:CR=1 FL=1